MKIVFFVKYYDGFIDSLLQKLPANKSYKQLHDFVQNESSNIFSPFIKVLNKKGHNASMIIPNLELLQKKWCQENKIEFNNLNWMYEVPQSQIKKENPDILFMSSNFEYYGDFLNKIRPNVGKVCAWISCPIDNNLNLSNIDHIFTLFEPHYKTFTQLGKPTTFTQAAFDSSIIKDLPKSKQYDLTFIGGIGGYHKTREKYLKALIKKTPIKIWGYGYRSKNWFKDFIKQIKNGFIYNKVYQGEAWGMDMLKILSQSKITFNSHGDIAKGYAVNMRMFEATGTGALLITELTDDIHHFFEPGKEIVCYTSIDDAIEKIQYYLKNEKKREKIALAGQKRTLNNYTYEHLASKYVDIFKQLLNK